MERAYLYYPLLASDWEASTFAEEGDDLLIYSPPGSPVVVTENGKVGLAYDMFSFRILEGRYAFEGYNAVHPKFAELTEAERSGRTRVWQYGNVLLFPSVLREMRQPKPRALLGGLQVGVSGTPPLRISYRPNWLGFTNPLSFLQENAVFPGENIREATRRA